MRQGLLVAAVGAATLFAMAGCAKPQPPAPKVAVAGQDLKASQPVTCARKDHSVYIAMGQAPTVLSAVLTDTSPPRVNAVVFDDVNGVTLLYRPGAAWTPAPGQRSMQWVPGQGWVPVPTVTVNGNSYTITGTASGQDSANHQVSKDFHIDATCP